MVFYMKNENKNKSNFSIVKLFFYPIKGLYFILYLIYSFFKYSFKGLECLLSINFSIIKKALYGILFICVCIFDIFKLIGKTILKPFKKKKVKNKKTVKIEKDTKQESKKEKVKKIKKKKEENKDVINKKELKKQQIEELAKNFIEQKEKEKQEKERLLEIKNKKKQEEQKEKKERLRKKKINEEAYVNENVKIEKPTISMQIKNLFKKIGMVFVSIGSKITNNSFSKNRRNKKDMKRQALLIDFEGEDAKKSEKKLLYEYVAKDKNGKIIKDYFNAYSKVEVHSYLLSEGYEVYSIKTNKFIQFFHKNSNTNKTRFKNKDLIFFLTQLSTYIKAGIPLVESLRIISRQYKKKAYQKIFRSVIYELTIGENFSSAMEKQNVAFPKLLINMVKTAEMTGSLPEVLDDMANYYTEAEETRKQMVTAMTYPTIVFLFAIAVMIFIMVYVVPQFVEIFETMDTKLPGITLMILNLSSFLTHYYIFIIIAVVAFVTLFIVSYKKIRGFRTMCQWIMMHIPIINNTIIYNEVTMFTKTFSSLLAHNVPITDCMEILNKITNNEIYKMLILDTITNLARGGKISDAFKDHWAFPVPAYEMIVTGEMTGELAEMMGKVSSYYQNLHKNSVTRIKTFIEPALTIFLTFGVGVILLSIIVPMFSMYSAVQEMG